MAELTFTNSDARPKFVTVKVRKRDVPDIMRWYGSHHAGDRYRVTLNGVRVAKDANGEPLDV